MTVAPKKQSISLVNKIKKQLTIKWKKNTKASGYQVVYSTNKKFTGKKTVRKAKTTISYKIKGLKKGKILRKSPFLQNSKWKTYLWSLQYSQKSNNQIEMIKN